MILFAILSVIAFSMLMFLLLTVTVGGVTFVVVFADVIVCVAIIIFIIKRLTKRKK